MFDGMDEDTPIIEGPPETWADFCDRVQRQIGKGSRVFIVRQPESQPILGARAEPPFVMILVPGPFREGFLP